MNHPVETSAISATNDLGPGWKEVEVKPGEEFTAKFASDHQTLGIGPGDVHLVTVGKDGEGDLWKHTIEAEHNGNHVLTWRVAEQANVSVETA